VERLRRELKVEARGRLQDAARRAEADSSRSGSMQATVAKLRVQLDAAKKREEQAQEALSELKKERGTVQDKETENSALRAQLADVRAQAEADRRAARAAQSSLQSQLRDTILKQSYRNSPGKHSEMSSAVDRRRVERDAETIVQQSRRRSLELQAPPPPPPPTDEAADGVAAGVASVDISQDEELEGDRLDVSSEAHDADAVDDNTPTTVADTSQVQAAAEEHWRDMEQNYEQALGRLAAERDTAQEQLAKLSTVCKVLEVKVASQDKRIRQLGEATATAERNAQMQSKERELMAIQKERLKFQLERYRKKERKQNASKPDPASGDDAMEGGSSKSTATILHGVSDKVRASAEALANELVGAARQELSGHKETVAKQQHTILELHRKMAQLRVALDRRAAAVTSPSPAGPAAAAESAGSSAPTSSRLNRSGSGSGSSSPGRRRSKSANRSPLRHTATARTRPAAAGEEAAARRIDTPGQGQSPTVEDDTAQVNEEEDEAVANEVQQEDDADDEEEGPGGIDAELWASSVATALAFRAFQQGVRASRSDELGPATQSMEMPMSPGDRLFKFASADARHSRRPESPDRASSDGPEEPSHWDIDVTSANSSSFLGATLREGRSPPRSSPVQMNDEGRLPGQGAGQLFAAVATGSM